MEITPTNASDILGQIRQNQWKWLGVKRFTPEAYTTADERYAALEQHHVAETGRMIEVIEELCRTVESLAKSRQESASDSD
jgi:hypothetical protein